MPELVAPTTAVHRSFLAAVAEEQTAGQVESTINLPKYSAFEQDWDQPDGFAAYVQALHADGDEDTPRPEGHVPGTMLWWVDGQEFLGRLHIRHRLNKRLRVNGGHIGYTVRPSARGRGHATAMLAAALPIAANLGITAALLTVDPDNEPSRRVIDRNGGRFIEERGGELHFRVPTTPRWSSRLGRKPTPRVFRR